MSSSTDPVAPVELPAPDLPGKTQALWRAMAFAYRAEPRLLVVAFATNVVAFVPDALGALWLKLLADGAVAGRADLMVWAAVGLAGSGAASWLLRIVGGRLSFRFRQRMTVAIEAHVMGLQASVATVEHHERASYLDRIEILRDHAFRLDHMYGALIGTIGSIARLAITVGLLVSVHPVLAVLALFAVPTVVVSSWRAGVQRETEERAAPYRRLARHLLDVGTLAGPGKEVRISGTGERIVEQRRDAWYAWFAPVSAVRWASGLWLAGAWALFGAAYAGAIVLVAWVMGAGPGDVLLVVAAGANLSRYLGMTAAEADFLRWCLDASQRLAWLEDFVASRSDHGTEPAPDVLETGIRLEDVSFRYPGTDAWVLRDVTLDLPAGSVVAIVGENGAGKTTLVKLLCRFYEPTEGRILVDGVPLADIRADEWRTRLGGAFQDFMRFELFARQTVGLGELARMEEVQALEAAVERGGAQDVVQHLPRALDTQLGPTWPDGVELSFGQWQKLALARGFMRDDPLVLALDEPTAALDAETEHALFERFAARSRASREDGRITVLVSHRFSTVRMADRILVIDDGHIVEVGSHDELVLRGGLYAELYDIQARAYR